MAIVSRTVRYRSMPVDCSTIPMRLFSLAR